MRHSIIKDDMPSTLAIATNMQTFYFFYRYWFDSYENTFLAKFYGTDMNNAEERFIEAQYKKDERLRWQICDLDTYNYIKAAYLPELDLHRDVNDSYSKAFWLIKAGFDYDIRILYTREQEEKNQVNTDDWMDIFNK